MKKSNSENSFLVNPFNAKPPVSAIAANITSRPVKMGPNSYPRPKGSSGITSPSSTAYDSSPFRSTSSSPRRHISPDCSKLKLVSAGNSFCLVKEEKSPTPNDDIRNGRKSPFITSRSWPKALRTRSASKERISSRQGILQKSIEQIKAFQEAKISEPYYPTRYRDAYSDDSSCDRTTLTKSTSMACLSRPSLQTDKPVPRGILKTNFPQVPRVNERIKALQNNIDETKSKPTTTLPWSSKLCKDNSINSLLRKTASSPCLFVKKSSVKIKTVKSPIKMYSTITNVGSAVEEKLSRVAHKELHEWESNGNQQHTPRDTACMGNSHELFDKIVTDGVLGRELAFQDRPEYINIPYGDILRTYDEAQRTIENGDNEEDKKGELFNEQEISSENVSCIQNEQLKFNEITLQNKRLLEDIPQRGSTLTSSKEIFRNDTSDITFPQAKLMNNDFFKNVDISGNSYLTGTEDSDRPQNSTCLLSKQIGLPSGLSATSGAISHRRTCNEQTQSQTCDNLAINDHVSDNTENEGGTDVDIIVTKEIGDSDRDIDKVSQLEKDFTFCDLAERQENNGKQILSNNAEHMNSSEDEEIQKELSSILTNGHEVFKGQLPQPRCFNNSFMNEETKNRQSLKNSQNNANTVSVISESNFVGISDSPDTGDDVLQDKRREFDLNISKNAPKSSFNLTSELEGDISKISINQFPRPIISSESAKMISFSAQEREESVDGKASGIKDWTKSAPKITHLGNHGVGVHNMYGAVPRLLGSNQFRSEREAAKSDLYADTCEIKFTSGVAPAVAQRKDKVSVDGYRKVVYRARKGELEQSDLSESSSRQDESSPPRDSPSPESSSSDNEVSDDELSRIRQRSFNTRRGSMPEREIDEEDTETAELQVNLRKISGRSFIPSVKLASVEKDDNENISPENSEKDQNKHEIDANKVSLELFEPECLKDPEFEEHRRPVRRGSMPEREINEDDTETAEFQTNIRKLSAKSQTQGPIVKSLTENKSSSEFEEELISEIEHKKDSQSNENIQLEAPTKSTKEAISSSMNHSKENKQIFRPAIPARGRVAGGLRRSRTWQGFGSGLRYESVSDAGLPPPPPTPNGAKSSEGGPPRQAPSSRQSLPRSYRPLSNLRRNPESGPKSWRRPTGSAFPSTAPVVGHSRVRSLGEQGGISRSLSEGNVFRDWEESDEEVEYECRVTCSVRQPNQEDKMSMDNILSEDISETNTMIHNPVEMADKVEEEDNGREDLTPAQIQQLMSVIAGMESIKRAGGEEGPSAGSSGSPPPTDEEIQQFIDYVGMGVINNDRLEYEERRKRDQEEENQPEPPKRNKTASQYFWRRHYLSIIQEDEEEHTEQTPGSSRSCSRANSRPGSTYENNFNRISRVLGAMSPLALEQRGSVDTSDKAETIRDVRASWGSEMSVDSLTSVNSILSEEGSITSNGSFISDTCQTDLYQTSSDQVSDNCQKRASQSLSCLLDSVHPPSNTPDSMMSCESPTARLSKSEIDNDEGVHVIKFKMGSKFKQSIQEIEESKRKDGEDESESSNSERGDAYCSRTGDTSEGGDTITGDSDQSGTQSRAPSRGDPRSSPGRSSDSPIQINTILKAEEAEGGKEVLGDIKQSFLRLAVNPLASPRQGRKNLTISTLIAECEEYVKTDEFTKDLSDELVNLFRGEASSKTNKVTNPPINGNQLIVSEKPGPITVTPFPEESEKMKKPPKIPDSMRTKPVIKLDKQDKTEKNEKNNIPKFPLNLRGSTYDNVGDSEAEDEGIDNDYSDDSGTATVSPSTCTYCQTAGCDKHESSPALTVTSEGYDSAYESDKKHVPGDLGFQDSEKNVMCENRARKPAGITAHKKQSLNPFLTSEEEDNEPNPFKTDIKNTNPFENDCDGLNPFVKDDDNNPFNENEMSTSQGSINESLTASQNSIEDEMTISNASFEDYESVISDIEETLSILSRNSRSTTPASEMCFNSRTPTPSFGQINYFSTSDLSQKSHKSVSDKHVIPIVTVFDDLKDYLSDSDLSLDYKIALQRRKHKNLKNLNKQAQLSSFLTSKKSKINAEELPKFEADKTRNDDKAHQGRHLDTSLDYPTRSLTCPNIFHQAQSFPDSPQVSPKTAVRDNMTFGTKTLPNISLCENTSTNTNEILNCREITSHKEVLSKHKQENDCAVKKINNSLDLRTRRSPSLTRGQSLEPIVEENLSRSMSKDQRPTDTLWGCDVVKVSGYAVEGQFSQPISSKADLSNRCETEKIQFLNGESNTGSLKRKKQFRTASLSDLLQESNEKLASTQRVTPLDPLTFNYTNSSKETASCSSIANTFQATSSKQPVFSRLAVNKSISECNLNQWIGQPPLSNNQERQLSMPPESRQTQSEQNIKTHLRSSISEQALNVQELDIIRNYMGLAPAEERLQDGGSNLSKGQVGEKWGRNCKIGEMYDHEYGVKQGQNPRNNQRSTSLEPENLRCWGDRGHNNRQDNSRKNCQELNEYCDPNRYYTDTGVSYFGEVAPVEGIFYAKPALLDSESDSDVDTDDAQTVIFKSSPYSSPGLVLSRSASMTMTPLPLSPLTMTPQPPVSPDADSPPPRPPPPVNYTPSHDQFSSLPRNWRAKRKFFET